MRISLSDWSSAPEWRAYCSFKCVLKLHFVPVQNSWCAFSSWWEVAKLAVDEHSEALPPRGVSAFACRGSMFIWGAAVRRVLYRVSFRLFCSPHLFASHGVSG